jgi:hypothetical protein
MKRREAKRLIVLEWDRWIQTQTSRSRRAGARNSLKFFIELQDAQSALLDFRFRGYDKWRLVHDWLFSERRVNEEIGTPVRGRPVRKTAGRPSSRSRTVSPDAQPSIANNQQPLHSS